MERELILGYFSLATWLVTFIPRILWALRALNAQEKRSMHE